MGRREPGPVVRPAAPWPHPVHVTGTGCVVFVSHSCKDLEPDVDGHALDVRIALQRLIEDELKAEAWIDRGSLAAGDVWHQQIDDALAVCDAAVILLNEHALRSRFVHYEVAVLTHRAATDKNFLLIPVLLAPLTVNDLRVSPSYGIASLTAGPIDLAVPATSGTGTLAPAPHGLRRLPTLQLVKETDCAGCDDSIDFVIDKVRAGLGGIRPTSYPLDDEGEWQVTVDGLLRLNRLAERIYRGLGDAEPADDQPHTLRAKAELLTRHLFDKGLDLGMTQVIENALRDPYDQTERLVRELRPLWVDRGVAQQILRVSTDPTTISVVRLGVEDVKLGEHCVLRAVGNKNRGRIVTLPAWRHLDRERARLETDQLMMYENFAGHQRPARATDAGRSVIVPGGGGSRPSRALGLRDGPRFVLVPPDLPPDTRQEALQAIVERWQYVTAVVLSGQSDRQQDLDYLDDNGNNQLAEAISVARVDLSVEIMNSVRAINRGLDRMSGSVPYQGPVPNGWWQA